MRYSFTKWCPSFFTFAVVTLLMSLYTRIYMDYEDYWAHAPLPFYIFILVQATLLCLLAWVLRLQSRH